MGDLDEPGFDTGNSGAAENQNRPEGGKRDNRDFHPVAETENQKCDRNQRDGRNRSKRLDGDLHQSVGGADQAKKNSGEETE